MLTKDMLKNQVEDFLRGKGDFVQIDYLNRYLKLMPSIEMRKFAYIKLSEIYEKRKMFTEAARAYRNASMNCTIFREKVNCLIEEAKRYIKATEFIESDKAVKIALSEATFEQKKQIAEDIKAFYRKVAEEFEKEMKRNQASKIYEKMLKMNFSEEEKQKIKLKLKELYEKLGKIKEIRFLEGI